MDFLGVDTGGTFTDFVLWRDGQLRVHKVLSTPTAPEQAILQGIRELGLSPTSLKLVHGSTVATNAVLEGKGVRTAFVTNRGFADLLTIGRQNREALYDLQPPPRPAPVPPELCLELDVRRDARGGLLAPLETADLSALAAALCALQVEAVAVSLMFSYGDDSDERAIAAALPGDLFVSLSSEVLPQIGEYERAMATWLNAWVGPLVKGYLARLREGLPGTALSVMQSSGDTVAADQAGDQAVRMLLSGPAGGLVAARFVGETAGSRRLLSFDMGGTSTDVALLEGAPTLTSEGRIGPYPVAVPMVDMHTIGAGGGSIAWLDDGDMLQVGPQSAGADPGPACYGRGGERATVTDANLLLGRLRADAFLGGDMALDRGAAETALARLAGRMATTAEAVAQGIVAIANEHMARALRAVSIQRGIDPRGFTLVSFGGAGGLHVCELAQVLGLREALVPVHGGVLSALGMLVARPGRQLLRTWQVLLDAIDAGQVASALARLADEGLDALRREGLQEAQCETVPSLDLRYQGQAYTLNIAWRGDIEQLRADFHQAHQARYGHRLGLPVELVNLRMAVSGPAAHSTLSRRKPGPPAVPFDRVTVVGCEAGVPCYRRDELAVGQSFAGPAVITEQVATTWLAPGWQGVLDDWGNLRLSALS